MFDPTSPSFWLGCAVGAVIGWVVLRQMRPWFWKRQRMRDLNILWPECKRATPNIDYARAAFARHAFKENAWVGHYGTAELATFLGKLE